MIKYSKIKNCIIQKDDTEIACVVHRRREEVELHQYRNKDSVEPDHCLETSLAHAEELFKYYMQQGFKILF